MKKNLLALAVGMSLAAVAVASPVEETPKFDGDYTFTKDTQVDKIDAVGNWVVNGGDVTVNVNYDTFFSHGKDHPLRGKGTLTVNNGKFNITQQDLALSLADIRINGGVVTVGNGQATGDGSRTFPALGAYDSFVMAGGTLNVDGGRIWVGDSGDKEYRDMVFAGGTVNMTGTGAKINGTNILDDKGNQYANRIVLSGADIQVGDTKKAGATASIEAHETILSAGSLTVNTGATLTLASKFTKNSIEKDGIGKPNTDDKSGYFLMTGGKFTVAEGGNLTSTTGFCMTGGTLSLPGLSVGTALEKAGSNVKMQDFRIEGGVADLGAVTVNGGAGDFELMGGTVTMTELTVEKGEMFLSKNAVIVNGAEGRKGGVKTTLNGTLVLTDLTGEDRGKTATELTGLSFESGTVNTTNELLSFGEGGKLTVAKDFGEGSELGKSVYADSLLAFYHSGSAAHGLTEQMLVRLGEYATAYGDVEGQAADKIKAGEAAVREASRAAVVGGIYNVAYDAQSLVSDALMERVKGAQGTGVWAQAIASFNSADNLYGTSGYEADIYGGMLGVDTTIGNGFVLGGALTVATADGNSVGSNVAVDTDADIFGVNFYASKSIEDLRLSAELGYMTTDTDMTATYAGAVENSSLDTDVWTVGVRADWAAVKGDAWNVTPYVGLRYASISPDDNGVVNHESLNVFEAPIGVNVAMTMPMGSWSIKPALDLSVVPQFGDKEAEFGVTGAAMEEIDVLDGSLGRAKLGVEAVNGAMSFGLDYRYGFGADDRANHTLNANFRYNF